MISIKDLAFRYREGDFTLKIGDLEIPEGEKFMISGPSGSGKTTLVNIIAGILKPTSGSVRVAGIEISKRNDRLNRRFRLDNVGFIFQNFELLEYLPVERNILLPYSIGRKMRVDAEVLERMRRSMETMGIWERRRAYPRQLSQGEKQRVAICRAVINAPRLIMADEPTANLDPDNSARVMELIRGMIEQNRSTFVMVTHDPSLRPFFNRRLDLKERSAGGDGAETGEGGGES